MHSHLNAAPINALPIEVLLNIAGYFHHTNMLTLSPISSLWYSLEQDDQVWEIRFKRYFPDIQAEVRDDSAQDEFGKTNYQASFKQACKILKKHFNNQEAFEDCLAFRGRDVDRIKIILGADDWKERIERRDCFEKNLFYFLRAQEHSHYRQTILDLIYKKYQSDRMLTDEEVGRAAQYGQIDLLRPLFGLIYDINMPPTPEVDQRYAMNYWEWYANVNQNSSLVKMKVERRVYPFLSEIICKAIEFSHEDIYQLIEDDGDCVLDQVEYRGQRKIFTILHRLLCNQHITISKYLSDKIFNLLKTFPEMQAMPNLAVLQPLIGTYLGYEVEALAPLGLFFWAVLLKQDKYIADCQFSEEDKRLLADDQLAEFLYKRAYKNASNYFIALIKKGCVHFSVLTPDFHSGRWHPTETGWVRDEIFIQHPLYSILATKNYSLLRKIFLQVETAPDVKRYLLEHAAKEDDYFSFKFMINNGAVIDENIINAAVGFESVNVIKLIVSQPYNEPLMHKILIKNPTADIISILPDNFDFDRMALSGSTLLVSVIYHMYCGKGTLNDLKVLIERGADPFFESNSGPGRTARERLEAYTGYNLEQFVKGDRFLGCFFYQDNIKAVLQKCLNNPDFYLSKIAPEKRDKLKMLVEAWDYISRVEYERLEPEYYASLSSI